MFLSRLRALTLAVLLVALGAPLLLSAAAAPAAADTGAGTATGSWHRWQPLENHRKGSYDTATTPTVTVDQTTDLVDQVVHVTWQNFTPSSNVPTYAPAPGVTAAQGTVLYGVEVLECRASVPSDSPIGQQDPQDCYTADVTSPVDGGHGQNNAVVAVTQPDGTGYADLHVENGLTNDLLGCDATHACTVVVVPNNGGNGPQPGSTGTSKCDDHSQDIVGPPTYDQIGTAGATYVGGACSWADRIEVPIHFAALPTDCPNVTPAFTATGSPLLRRGLGQLQAGWCQGAKALTFGYNSTSSEYEARAQFGSGADVALVTRPADATQKHVAYAPVADTAISIAYYVDNVKTGRPMTDLILTPRLVAKLLTQSYQPFGFNCQSDADRTKASNGCAPEVSGNPASILDDPEFQHLNFRGDHPDRSYFPGSGSGNHDALGGFFVTTIAGDSDLTYELTRWIAADADAHAFLSGKPDPWGMRINPNYTTKSGVLYPTSQFQSLDPGWTPDRTNTARHFLEGFQGTWNPLTGLDNVSSTLVANRSSGVDTTSGQCPTGFPADCIAKPGLPVNFPKLSPEPVGARDLWAIVDNASAQAYRFPTAQLVSGTGTPVAPTQQSMAAAVAGMTTDKATGTQSVDHAHTAAGAYPLTVPVYAMVATCGVSAAKATAISSFLGHVTASQSYGVEPGTLAPGLLALTPEQLARTKAVAALKSASACTTSGTTGTTHHHSGGSGSGNGGNGGTGGSGGSDGSGTGGSGTGGGSGSTGAGTDATSTHRSSAPTGKPSSSAPAPVIAARDAGYKAPDQSGTMAAALPIVLIVGAAFLIGAPLVWLLTSTSAGAALASRAAFWR